MNVIADEKRELFAFSHAPTVVGGASFDYINQQAHALKEWLGRHGVTGPWIRPRGTIGNYEDYCTLVNLVVAIGRKNAISCTVGLHPQLIGLEGRSVVVRHTDGRRERFVVGTTDGVLKIHTAMTWSERAKKYIHLPIGTRPFASVRVTDIAPSAHLLENLDDETIA